MYYKDEVYKVRGSIAVLFDLWMPEGDAPEGGWPLFLFTHGGGWQAGDKNDWNCVRPLKEKCEREGIAFATVGYRHAGHGAHMPVPAADVADAVLFFAKNAEKFRLNPLKFFLGGASSGGHLALLTALSDLCFAEDSKDDRPPYRICGVLSMAGPATLEFDRYPNDGVGAPCAKRFLEGFKEDPARANACDYVEKGIAPRIPLFLMQGAADTTVPPEMVTDFHRLCESKGYSSELHTVSSEGHYLDGAESAVKLEQFTEWMKKQM